MQIDRYIMYIGMLAQMLVQIGVSAFVACSSLAILIPDFFFISWHSILLTITCTGIVLAIVQRIYCRHRVPASMPPVLRSCIYFGVFWAVTLFGTSLKISFLLGVVFFLLLYLSQLWVDRIESLSGGYILLFCKAISRILVERKRRATKAVEVLDQKPIIVIDPFGWYSFSDVQLRVLAERFPGHLLVNSFWKVRPDDYPLIDIVFGAPPKRLLKSLVSLSWIHIPSSGMNGYDNKTLYSSQPRITSSAGVYGVPIAEYTLTLMLTMSKGVYSGVLNNKCGYGNDIVHSLIDFDKSTVLILGLGDIGQNIATRCAALGANVIGIKRDVLTPVQGVSELYTMDRIDDLLPCADFVVLSLPATPETNGVINETRLRLMKRTAVLVNVGRGNAVNQKDLKAAIRRKDIASAALDVTTPDPLLPFSSLFGYRDVLCTLHHSSISEMNSQRAIDVFMEYTNE